MLSHRHLRLLLLLTLGFIFLAPDSAYAQRPRRGGGKARARHGGDGTDRNSNKANAPVAGSTPSTFKEFEPVTDQDDDTLLGVLKVKPLKGGSLKINIRRDKELKLIVGSRTFEMDPIPEFLTKGVFCTATWEWDAKPGDAVSKRIEEGKVRRHDPKRLQSLELNTLMVEGEIVDIGGDIITLKVKPVNDQQWPDVAARMARHPEKYLDKKMRVPAKTLRLRIVDDLSAFKDAAAQELSLGDFEVEQKIQALIVYAGSSKKSTGILVDLNSFTADEREGETEAGPRDGPGEGGGKQPRRPRPRRGRPRRG